MSIHYKILGKPGKDNSVIAWINSGNNYYRLLFDCGENTLLNIKQSEINAIDYLFFSHLHIDHAAGFDYFFRRNYDRENKHVYLFGPPETIEIIHNRLKGYKWNLVNNSPGVWEIKDIAKDKIKTSRFFTKEGFSINHKISNKKFNGIVLENDDFKIESIHLNHIVPSLAYKITEKNKINIDKEKLFQLKLKAGPWLEKIKNISYPSSFINIDGTKYEINDLRKKLLVETKGQSLAYLTDFIYDKTTKIILKDFLKNCDTIICESQYKSEDIELAKKNYHLTAKQTAEIARNSNAGKLILFHISDRYKFVEFKQILKQAREVFPNSYFPDNWNIKN